MFGSFTRVSCIGLPTTTPIQSSSIANCFEKQHSTTCSPTCNAGYYPQSYFLCEKGVWTGSPTCPARTMPFAFGPCIWLHHLLPSQLVLLPRLLNFLVNLFHDGSCSGHVWDYFAMVECDTNLHPQPRHGLYFKLE